MATASVRHRRRVRLHLHRLTVPPPSLSALLDRLARGFGSETVGSLLGRLGSRSFGPVLALCALFAILPTGAIPGISAVPGLVALLAAGQLALGRPCLALPRRLSAINVAPETVAGLVRRVRPTARFLDPVLKPRLLILTERPWSRLVAGVAAMTAVSMTALALVPFAALPPGAVLLLIGLGLTTRDGVVVAAGLTTAIGWFAALAGLAAASVF